MFSTSSKSLWERGKQNFPILWFGGWNTSFCGGGHGYEHTYYLQEPGEWYSVTFDNDIKISEQRVLEGLVKSPLLPQLNCSFTLFSLALPWLWLMQSDSHTHTHKAIFYILWAIFVNVSFEIEFLSKVETGMKTLSTYQSEKAPPMFSVWLILFLNLFEKIRVEIKNSPSEQWLGPHTSTLLGISGTSWIITLWINNRCLWSTSCRSDSLPGTLDQMSPVVIIASCGR